jgi:Lrp/AsnC family leucine-responsive transcriptional regulator
MRTERKPERVLDKIDRKILALLQANARLQMKEIAEQVGLSPAPCIERVKRLEEQKVIEGYHARVSPEALGLSMLVFIEISIVEKTSDRVNAFQREIARVPDVIECYWVSGDFDYLVKARLKNMGDYRRLLLDVLLKVPGARQVKSSVVIEEIKNSPVLPIVL